MRNTLFAAALGSALIAAPAMAVQTAPPGGEYKQVSELVKLPDFLPGIGQLYVDPATLPLVPSSPTITMESS